VNIPKQPKWLVRFFVTAPGPEFMPFAAPMSEYFFHHLHQLSKSNKIRIFVEITSLVHA
jgi:hypothetical protein